MPKSKSSKSPAVSAKAKSSKTPTVPSPSPVPGQKPALPGPASNSGDVRSSVQAKSRINDEPKIKVVSLTHFILQ